MDPSAARPPASAASTPTGGGGNAIVVRGLRKTYGGREAVAGIDLTVRETEVFALLGPNGAGKTTTVEILEGYRQRTAGEVSVLGHDPGRGEEALKRRIGIVLQSTGVEPYLSVAEVLRLYRGYYPNPRPVAELLDLVGLAEKADVRVKRLSGGQRRRLDLAVALAGDPDVVFLDEPTTGFDPGARRHAWDVVRNLAALGKTVFLTTHFMDEAQVLADRIAVLVRGEIVAEGTPMEVIGQASRSTVVRVRLPSGAPPLPSELGPPLPPTTTQAPGLAAEALEFHTQSPTEFVHRLTGWAVSAGFAFEELTVSPPSLEDTYLALTGGGDGEDEAESEGSAGAGREAVAAGSSPGHTGAARWRIGR